jgi:hypothetical protein
MGDGGAVGGACAPFILRGSTIASMPPDVRLPGGRPVFPEVPTRTPEEVLWLCYFR